MEECEKELLKTYDTCDNICIVMKSKRKYFNKIMTFDVKWIEIKEIDKLKQLIYDMQNKLQLQQS